MFDRKLCKEKGKEAFQKNYWLCVLAALIIALLCDGMISYVFSANSIRRNVPQIRERMSSGSYGAYGPYGVIEFPEYTDEDIPGFLGYGNEYTAVSPGYSYDYETGFKVSGSSGLWFLLGVFVFGVINIGGRRFFMNNRSGNARLGDLFAYFQDSNYPGHVWTMFAVRLQVFLWSLLFVVPGIIKAYEYAMVPYIAADNPEMKKKEIFALSKQMMTGHKWELFVFDLSFIGWNILSVLTAGVLGFLYVFPYKKAATAEVYFALKNGLYY